MVEPMRTLIAGSRTIDNYHVLCEIVDHLDSQGLWNPLSIISGLAPGVDTLAVRLSEDLSIPLESFPARWKEHGRGAGFIRNAEMGKVAECAIIIWDGVSRGTLHMKHTCERKGIPVHTFIVKDGVWEAKDK